MGLNNGCTQSLLAHTASCQRDIDRVVECSASWGLKLNVDKCAVMRFRGGHVLRNDLEPYISYFVNGIKLEMVESYKDLGVTVDKTLRFHSHIYNVVCKAGGLATNLLRSTVNRDSDFMKNLFISHIRPHLEYASLLWNTQYIEDLKLLEAVQRRWTKRITALGDLPYGQRLSSLNLYSVRGRLLRADMVAYWKIFHGFSTISPENIFVMAPNIGTRGHSSRFSLSIDLVNVGLVHSV